MLFLYITITLLRHCVQLFLIQLLLAPIQTLLPIAPGGKTYSKKYEMKNRPWKQKLRITAIRLIAKFRKFWDRPQIARETRIFHFLAHVCVCNYRDGCGTWIGVLLLDVPIVLVEVQVEETLVDGVVGRGMDGQGGFGVDGRNWLHWLHSSCGT